MNDDQDVNGLDPDGTPHNHGTVENPEVEQEGDDDGAVG